MDPATILGITFAFSLMGYAIAQGGDVMLFINLPALAIVIGGTLGACLIYYPLGKILGIFGVLGKAFIVQKESYSERVKLLGEFSGKARKLGLLSLTEEVKAIDDRFFRRCMELTLDGTDPGDMKKVMGREIVSAAERHRLSADVVSTMGTFAPAMGMIGTLIGLVKMLQSLDNPANIGPAMAVALLSTLYGALLANLVFFPLAGKLRYRSWREIIMHEVTLEGVVGIASGDHPTVLEQKLLSFITPSMESDDPGKSGKKGGFTSKPKKDKKRKSRFTRID